MAVIGWLLFFLISLDWAKKCKPVNYKFESYGFKYDYDRGCGKGCFYNATAEGAYEVKEPGTAQQHVDIQKCAPCSDIKNLPLNQFPQGTETYCNEKITCHWKGGKCIAVSCPIIVKKEKCKAKGYFNGNQLYWKNGKCKNDDEDVNCSSCSVLTGEKSRTQCEYQCEYKDYEVCHQKHKYEHSKKQRLYAHKVFGCLYASNNEYYANVGTATNRIDLYFYPSSWSVWAFVVTLVVGILFVVGVIAAIIALIFIGDKRDEKATILFDVGN